MGKHMILFSCGIFLVLCLTISMPGHAADLSPLKASGDNPKPQNTVILTTEMDARFSQDFSSLLKYLRLDWVVLNSSKVPDALHDMNLIFLGHPDDGFIGVVMEEILTGEEIKTIQNAEDQ